MRRHPSSATALAGADRTLAAVQGHPGDHPPRRPGLDVDVPDRRRDFEMEDQRNWSDASYKTYVRPLALPWPFVLRPASAQPAVAVSVRPPPAPRRPARRGRRHRRRDRLARPAPASPRSASSSRRARSAAALAGLDRLSEIGPQRMLLHFDPTAGDGPDALAAFARLRPRFPADLRPRMRRPRRGRPRRGTRRGRRAVAARRPDASPASRCPRRSTGSRRPRAAPGRSARRSRKSMRAARARLSRPARSAAACSAISPS